MHTSVHLSPLACLHTATQHLLYSCEGTKEIKKRKELGYTQWHLQTRQGTCVFSIANICQPCSPGHLEMSELVMFTWFHKHYRNPFPPTRSTPAERCRAGGLATLNIIPGKVVGKGWRIRLSLWVLLSHSFILLSRSVCGCILNKSRVLTMWLHRTSSTCATSSPGISHAAHKALPGSCIPTGIYTQTHGPQALTCLSHGYLEADQHAACVYSCMIV